MAATALEALYDLDASAAGDIAERRLVESLSHDCVPGPLVKLLFERGRDPFPPLSERLEALSCDRHRLRPESALFSGDKDAAELLRRAAEEAQASGPACRKALEDLFGLGKNAGSSTSENP